MNVSDIQAQRRNRLLAALPPHESAAISADLLHLALKHGDPLYDADCNLQFVYFPAGASLSMLKDVANGDSVEVAAVGLEGMAGIHAILGGELVPDRCIAQIPGDAYRMPIAAFYKHFRELPHFKRLLHLYAQVLYGIMAQSVACNQLHFSTERCARWLLTSADRVGRSTFELTHEFLATMLGSSRPSVSLAASALQDAGLIKYVRGVMTITDRAGLESASCECYGATAAQLERVLPMTPLPYLREDLAPAREALP